MRIRRRIETTIETHQVWVVRGRVGQRQWCPNCTDRVLMFTPEEATALAGVSLRNIYRSIEAGHIHFRETPDGRLFVCLASLSATAG